MLLFKPGARTKKRLPRKPCPACVACDGASIPLEADMCARCREALKKRAEAKKPLQGQRWAGVERARRG
jgi:predicted nucleic acid-binding Zn ribbon protein